MLGEGEDQIHIVILETGKTVRIGIDAPESVHIRRDELEPLPAPPVPQPSG